MGNLGKRQIVLLVILGMVVAYGVYDLLGPSEDLSGKTPASSPKKAASQVVDQSQVLQKQMVAIKAPTGNPSVKKPIHLIHRAKAEWKRDPFVMQYDDQTNVNYPGLAGGKAQSSATGFSLTAISRKGDRAFVLINEEVLGLGESINGFLVAEILDKSVVLSRNNFTFTIRLREEE